MFVNMNVNVLERHVTCPDCKTRWRITCYINSGFSDSEDVYCPKCNYLLANFRCDSGYHISKINEEEE